MDKLMNSFIQSLQAKQLNKIKALNILQNILGIYEYFGAYLCPLKVKTSYLKEKMWYVSGLVVFKVECVLIHAQGIHDDS